MAGRYQPQHDERQGPERGISISAADVLPHSWLSTMGWEGEALRHSMVKHVAYFDRPRITFACRSCSTSRSGVRRSGRVVHVGSLRRLLRL